MSATRLLDQMKEELSAAEEHFEAQKKDLLATVGDENDLMDRRSYLRRVEGKLAAMHEMRRRVEAESVDRSAPIDLA